MNKSDITYALVWAKKIRAINLLGGKCQKCGERSIFVLEFHHKNEKRYNINSLHGYRWSIIRAEISKCKLLCRNCHNSIHKFGTDRNLRIKRKLLEIKGCFKCSQCGYDKNIGVLEFHHRHNKKIKLSVIDVRRKGIKWEDVLLEMDKCDVLCSNCHVKTYINIDKFNRLKSEIYIKVANHKELRPELNKEQIKNMYFNQKMRQVDIVKHFGCSKGTVSMIVKKLSQPSESGQKVTG